MKLAPEIAQCPRRSVEHSIKICHHGPEGDEEGCSDYRWIVPGQYRPWWVGPHPAIRRGEEGTLRVRSSHHQQSNGTDGGDPGPARVQGAVRNRNHDRDRKSTRLNSSHLGISYAVFC